MSTAVDGVSGADLASQEQVFARAFAAHDLEIARPLYHPDVVYLSPTVRLFDWPARIEGVERTIAFIALTIKRCEAIVYRTIESAVLDGGRAALVRVHFDWTAAGRRLRSDYLVRYAYRDGSGEVGVIASVTRPFCGACTRARLSADGSLYTCLFATTGHDLRALVRAGAGDDEIAAAIDGIWGARADRYSELRSAATRDLPKIEMSYIGG